MPSQRAPWPLYIISVSVAIVIFVFTVNHFQRLAPLPDPFTRHKQAQQEAQVESDSKTSTASETLHQWNSWSFDPGRDSLNLGLSDQQCDAAFPGLYAETDRFRDWHSAEGITEDDIVIWDNKRHGQVHVMINQGQLYVLDYKPGFADDARAKAALASMHRSLTAMPDPRQIPNIEFIVDIADDQNDAPEDRIVWSWCRRNNDTNTFVMPDFDGWSYPDDDVGGYEAFRTKLQDIEQPFGEKIPKAVWRGSLGHGHGTPIRSALLDAARGKPWADVEELKWKTREGFMAMEDFCNYQYVIQTEGNSWSGRLRYLQNCLSVPIIHNLDYVAHYYPLLKSSGPQQNYIEVRQDFSDLAEQMAEYLEQPELSAGIARESVKTFRDRYLTPAAEACYWRRMFKRWHEIQRFEPRLWKTAKIKGIEQHKMRGLSFERWAFRQENTREHGGSISVKPSIASGDGVWKH